MFDTINKHSLLKQNKQDKKFLPNLGIARDLFILLNSIY